VLEAGGLGTERILDYPTLGQRIHTDLVRRGCVLVICLDVSGFHVSVRNYRPVRIRNRTGDAGVSGLADGGRSAQKQYQRRYSEEAQHSLPQIPLFPEARMQVVYIGRRWARL